LHCVPMLLRRNKIFPCDINWKNTSYPLLHDGLRESTLKHSAACYPLNGLRESTLKRDACISLSCRYHHAAACIPGRMQIFVYGGFLEPSRLEILVGDPKTPQPTNELWIFNIGSRVWSRQTVSLPLKCIVTSFTIYIFLLTEHYPIYYTQIAMFLWMNKVVQCSVYCWPLYFFFAHMVCRSCTRASLSVCSSHEGFMQVYLNLNFRLALSEAITDMFSESKVCLFPLGRLGVSMMNAMSTSSNFSVM
jgi:hypothetical protein